MSGQLAPQWIQKTLCSRTQMFMCKKQIVVIASSTEAGYLATASCCGQGLVVQGEGSTYLVESHHIPTSASLTSQPPVSQTSRRTTRQEFVVPRPRSPTQSLVANEAASTGVDVRYGGATTTVTSLEAGQGSDLKQAKQIYGAAYTKLIKKVKKLGKTAKSNQARRRARIVVSDDEDDLEDPSKQGRKITKINQDHGISLVQHDAETQGRYGHDMEFDYDFNTAEKDVSIIEPVSTGGVAVTINSVVVSCNAPLRKEDVMS
nr:hypothetical protein [Tanacetum cinerariifolium]